MKTRHAPTLMAVLAALTLAGCGSAAVQTRPSAADATSASSSAFARAYRSALASSLQGMPPSRAAIKVLHAQPRRFARAIQAALEQDPLTTTLEGVQGWSLLADLPGPLAVPIAEEAIVRYGVAPPSGVSVPAAFLLSQIRHGPPWAVRAAVQALFMNGHAGTALELAALAAIPAADATDAQAGYYLPSSPTWLARVLKDAKITDAVKQAILGETYSVAPGSYPLLLRYTSTVRDPALQEQALVVLAQNGQPGAVRDLAAFSDRHHTFAGIVWPASLMLAVKQADPHGYIAQGMADVSALTGTPYTDVHRCIPQRDQCGLFLEGQAQYDPARLPQWRALLSRLQGHPGADDIAYIIGREEEIGHHYGQAVLAFDQALALPDGGMQYDAASRLVWVLDVEMTSKGIEQLIPAAPNGLRPLLGYARAVHLLREGRYGEAVAGLESLAADPQALTDALPGISYQATPFLRYFVAWQLRAAERLETLAKAKGTAEGAFRLAQDNFQNPLLYYMGLWQGTRAGYIAFASGGTYPTPAWMRYQAQFNNYAVAASLYARAARLAGKNAALRASDLYGEGESLVELSDYGSGSDLYPPYELERQAESLLRAAAAADPRAGVAAKALMSLYYLTGDKALLARVEKGYPGTSSAYDAKLRLEPRYRFTVQPLGSASLDFQPIWTTNLLSQSERSALDSISGTGSAVFGQETLLRIAPKLPQGAEPAVVWVRETAPGTLLVQWDTYTPADVPGLQKVYFPGQAYARVFGAFTKVRFQQVNYGYLPGLQ